MAVVPPEAETWDPRTWRTAMAVEVEDVDAVHAAALRRGLTVVYLLATGPWGIRRSFVRAADGTDINVHGHA